MIKVTRPASRVALVTLSRPRAFNQLCATLLAELRSTLDFCDAAQEIGAIVITGQERAFSIGADIKELSELNRPSYQDLKLFDNWDAVYNVKKPLIAATNGHVLGGGCELAMMCDIIYAGDKSQFGLPEIHLGTIPGCGGTQRLIRAVGKSMAMEMILSGRKISAREALAAGLVSKVYSSGQVVGEAVKLASQIASQSPLTTLMTKDAILSSFEMNLSNGLKFERLLFKSTFATSDQKEGMCAFSEKRDAKWTGT